MSIASITIGLSSNRAQMCMCTAVFVRTNDVHYYYDSKLSDHIDVLLPSVPAMFFLIKKVLR